MVWSVDFDSNNNEVNFKLELKEYSSINKTEFGIEIFVKKLEKKDNFSIDKIFDGNSNEISVIVEFNLKELLLILIIL